MCMYIYTRIHLHNTNICMCVLAYHIKIMMMIINIIEHYYIMYI